MGDVSSEPTMEEILSSIKRVIEESESAPARSAARRPVAKTNVASATPLTADEPEQVLELNERVNFPQVNPREIRRDEPVDERAPVGAAPQQQRAETILSHDAAQASRGQLEALSRMIVKPEAAGSDTLEGMVREMLRPMLRDWLDANLPQIVEAMVSKEIERISGRGL